MPLPGVPLLCLRAGRPQLKQFGAHRAGWHSVPLVRAGRVFPARCQERRASGAHGLASSSRETRPSMAHVGGPITQATEAPPARPRAGNPERTPRERPPFSPTNYDGGGSPGGMRGRGGEGGAAAGGRNRTGPGVRAGGRWRSDGTALLRGWAVHHYRWEPRSHED